MQPRPLHSAARPEPEFVCCVSRDTGIIFLHSKMAASTVRETRSREFGLGTLGTRDFGDSFFWLSTILCVQDSRLRVVFFFFDLKAVHDWAIFGGFEAFLSTGPIQSRRVVSTGRPKNHPKVLNYQQPWVARGSHDSHIWQLGRGVGISIGISGTRGHFYAWRLRSATGGAEFLCYEQKKRLKECSYSYRPVGRSGYSDRSISTFSS